MECHFSKGDPVEQMNAHRRNNATLHRALRAGEEKMLGVLCGIDAVGYEAHADSDPSKERPRQILENLVRVVNPTGRLGIIGVYVPEDPGASNEQAKKGRLQKWASHPLVLSQGMTGPLPLPVSVPPASRRL